jgi:NhaP-type Na+/H+ or K+/H+ antiporter
MHVLLAFALGIMLAHFLRSNKAVPDVAGKATTWSVCLLVFFLGVSIGGNATVMHALGTLGIQALVLSTGGVVGSVLVSTLVSRWFFEPIADEE